MPSEEVSGGAAGADGDPAASRALCKARSVPHRAGQVLERILDGSATTPWSNAQSVFFCDACWALSSQRRGAAEVQKIFSSIVLVVIFISASLGRRMEGFSQCQDVLRASQDWVWHGFKYSGISSRLEGSGRSVGLYKSIANPKE